MPIAKLPPLSMYIHVPWCVRKCPYCDFNSHAVTSNIPEEAYVDALLEDLSQQMPSVWGRQLVSIFIGGGTPSLFSPQSYEKLFSGIRALIPFQQDIEITMEANPGTAEAEKFAGFVEAGINRISIGVQSFNDNHLQALGRIHSAEEVEKAYRIARDAGCKNINLDLMYALPNQTLNESLDDLKQAIALSPEHLSWYQLTLEPNTLFYHQPPTLPKESVMDDIAEQGLALIESSGYNRYEVSAYSRGGKVLSVHNLNYWQFGDYLGIGAGAHGKITRADEQSIQRISKKRSPKDYLDSKKPFIESSKIIAQQELPLEFMMNAMRLKDGVDIESFFEHTGVLFSQIQKQISEAQETGLLELLDGRVKPSKRGYLFLNELLERFMPEQFPALNNSSQITIKQL